MAGPTVVEQQKVVYAAAPVITVEKKKEDKKKKKKKRKAAGDGEASEKSGEASVFLVLTFISELGVEQCSFPVSVC